MRTKAMPGAGAGQPSVAVTGRRDQLTACAIDALAELGYGQTSVAEVARRAGVSKGVVTYHFAARDDLIWAVVAEVFASIAEHVGARIEGIAPERFIATYLTAWTDYYVEHRREMVAIAEVWTGFRDGDGRPRLDARTLAHERSLVEAALAAGQADGRLGVFDTRVVAVSLKAALDGLLGQMAHDPELDLPAWRDQLIALWERATAPSGARRNPKKTITEEK